MQLTTPFEPLAQGRTAQVFPWSKGKVLKLFRRGWPSSLAEREVRGAATARSAGLRVPGVGEVFRFKGRVGLVCERCEARSLLRSLGERPWTLPGSARTFACLHANVHKRISQDLPSQRERLEKSIRNAPGLGLDERDDLLRVLHGLPDGDRICHGDFHPDNVLLEDSGPVIIDWPDATRGNPWADVARTSVLIAVGTLPGDAPTPGLLNLGRRVFRHLYLREYARLNPQGRDQYERWLPVAAAARLADGPVEERAALLRLIRGRG